jgi:hypothetical protein
VPITDDNIKVTDESIETTDNTSPAVSSWPRIVNRLARMHPPRGTPPHRWRGFVDDCHAFLRSGWAAKAGDRGWTAPDLFAFPSQWDSVGLLWIMNSGTLVELRRDWAEIEAAGSGRRRIFNRPSINASHRRDPLQRDAYGDESLDDDY